MVSFQFMFSVLLLFRFFLYLFFAILASSHCPDSVKTPALNSEWGGGPERVGGEILMRPSGESVAKLVDQDFSLLEFVILLCPIWIICF